MIDISNCPRGIEMLKMSKQIDDLQKEIEALRGSENE